MTHSLIALQKLSAGLFLTLAVHSAHAHEFWLEPESFHVKSGNAVSVEIKSGEGFAGISYPWIPERVIDTGPISDATLIPAVAGREPALRVIASKPGLTSLYYHSRPTKLNYDNFEDFEKFLNEESLLWVIDKHKQRGLSETGFSEYFSRYTKTLLSSDSAADDDSNSGRMPYEWVALTNPYSSNSDIESGYFLQLFEHSEPVADTHVTYFIKNKNVSGEAELKTARTNQSGIVKIPYEENSQYLVSAVLMTENESAEIPWHSHWVSITFGSRLQPDVANN